MNNPTKDEFQQLLFNLSTGKLGLIHIQNALRAHYRETLPRETVDILCGSGDGDAGLIAKHFSLLRQMIGAMELVVRRAHD